MAAPTSLGGGVGAVPLVITVHGTPAGQGRLSFYGRGRAVHSNHKRLMPWRAVVADAAKEQAHELCYAAEGAAPICLLPFDGPICIEITVTVPKPASAPKRRTTWPVTRYSGDWDHHARAVSDALTGIAYGDDSQIVEGTCRKVYPGEGIDALDRPGAVIRVWPVAS
jgi:Holliday junction resolvase RusA-like endonuclease